MSNLLCNFVKLKKLSINVDNLVNYVIETINVFLGVCHVYV